jgi:hypothetical protein
LYSYFYIKGISCESPEALPCSGNLVCSNLNDQKTFKCMDRGTVEKKLEKVLRFGNSLSSIREFARDD